jgi:type IV secretory pathway VirB3-like protein
LGLTRSAVFLGLPMNYLMILIGLVFGGFIATSSIIYMFVAAIVGTFVLKAIVAHDSFAVEVFLTNLSKFPRQVAFSSKKVSRYHA